MAFVKYGRSAISNQLTTIANALSSSSGGTKEKRVDLITSTQSWTAPAGVTYAIAHLVAGGGGGSGDNVVGSYGGDSSAFGVTHLGSRPGKQSNVRYPGGASSAKANTGQGGSGLGGADTSYAETNSGSGGDSSTKMAGASVTPGSSYTITVGAGGSGAGGNGGSGYVAIEYYIEA